MLVNTQFGQLAQTLDQDNTSIDLTINPADNAVIAIHAIYASFDSSVAGAELTIDDDTTEVFKRIFDDGISIEPGVSISFTKGNTVHIKLTASGGAGTLGNVVVLYSENSVGQ